MKCPSRQHLHVPPVSISALDSGPLPHVHSSISAGLGRACRFFFRKLSIAMSFSDPVHVSERVIICKENRQLPYLNKYGEESGMAPVNCGNSRFPPIPTQHCVFCVRILRILSPDDKTEINLSSVIWRREWDSNPRYGFPHAGFQDQYLQPLGHLSRTELLYLIFSYFHPF